MWSLKCLYMPCMPCLGFYCGTTFCYAISIDDFSWKPYTGSDNDLRVAPCQCSTIGGCVIKDGYFYLLAQKSANLAVLEIVWRPYLSNCNFTAHFVSSNHENARNANWNAYIVLFLGAFWSLFYNITWMSILALLLKSLSTAVIHFILCFRIFQHYLRYAVLVSFLQYWWQVKEKRGVCRVLEQMTDLLRNKNLSGVKSCFLQMLPPKSLSHTLVKLLAKS